MQAKHVSVGGQFRLTSAHHVYTRVMPQFLLPSLGYWGSKRGLSDCLSVSDGHIFATNDWHELIAIHPDNSVLPAKDEPHPGPHPGYETIDIDGCACEIGWCDSNDDSFIAVIRHGCQIGKGYTRDDAIDDALASLNAPGSWLRGPKPDHSGKQN
jgi:hypothetical protein